MSCGHLLLTARYTCRPSSSNWLPQGTCSSTTGQHFVTTCAVAGFSKACAVCVQPVPACVQARMLTQEPSNAFDSLPAITACTIQPKIRVSSPCAPVCCYYCCSHSCHQLFNLSCDHSPQADGRPAHPAPSS
jgi:hypothetical protein